jgi:hypothetical protein
MYISTYAGVLLAVQRYKFILKVDSMYIYVYLNILL